MQLAYTLGADDIFVRLIATARTFAATGGDDALVEWRGPAACSRRHVRPDGYGIYRRAGQLYGFFLEYDRGTMSARDYRKKFAAYYAYWASRRFERDYDGFPTILITAVNDAAEKRIAKVVSAAAVGRPAGLPLLLTSEWRISRDPTNPQGLGGAIWWDLGISRRRQWPGSIGTQA
ncbi:MAG TPA: replication-relaxation family protein [Chloroflexota bacterium]